MSFFTWLYGGSKSAAAARRQHREGRQQARTEAQTVFRPNVTNDPSPNGYRGPGDDVDMRRDLRPDYKGIEQENWYSLTSSDVDRIRYSKQEHILQVVFKDGSFYAYYDVEPEIFMSFLRAPSPGQFVHYVLIQYGYRYAKIGSGLSASPPAPPRFDGQPYAVPDNIQEIQAKAGRKPAEGGMWNFGEPVAKGVVPPHDAYFP